MRNFFVAKAGQDGRVDKGTASPEIAICGLVMPISAMGTEYTEDHWRRVRKILTRAVERAGLKAQLVWENAEVDVIQSRILQNLYENDVVICDVSGLNPNVMLETGLRLSTKKPTIVVTDKEIKPPFDIQDIGYINYPKDLEYNSTEEFINRLSEKIKTVVAAGDNYRPYISNFRFETITPTKVDVSSEEFLREKVDELAALVRRIERAQTANSANQSAKAAPVSRRKIVWAPLTTYIFQGTRDQAEEIESNIDEIDEAICHLNPTGDGKFELEVRRRVDMKYDVDALLARIDDIVEAGMSA